MYDKKVSDPNNVVYSGAASSTTNELQICFNYRTARNKNGYIFKVIQMIRVKFVKSCIFGKQWCSHQ